MPLPCPDRQTLRKLVLGEGTDEAAQELEAHVSGCVHCGEVLRLLADEDTLAGLTLEHCEPVEDEAHLSSLVGKLRALPVNLSAAREAAPAPSQPGEFHFPPGTTEHLAILAPAEAPHELGRLGVYRILRVLGSGGMGVVFLGEDLQLRRQVAVKALLPSQAADKGRERFLREARSVAALDHEHVVPIYHIGEERGTPFFVMKLLQGETLESLMRRESPLPIAMAVRIGKEIARGLSAAHEQGLIHRDIKPANIWLDSPGGRVKIVDFGLARPAVVDSVLTRTGTVIGTPACMAPEQIRGDPLDPRCDLFGLGCLLYELVTGASPFARKSVMRTIMAVVSHEPPPPATLRPECPPELSELILQLLAKDPLERIASAREVAERLGDR